MDWFQAHQVDLLLAVGGIFITLIVALVLHIRSSRQLENSVKKLMGQNTLVLRGLEEAGLVEYNRDEDGNIIGLILHFSASLTGSSSAEARLTVVPNNDDDTGTNK